MKKDYQSVKELSSNESVCRKALATLGLFKGRSVTTLFVEEPWLHLVAKYSEMQYSTMKCSIVQISAVHYTVVKYSIMNCCPVHIMTF